jgi:hypothetical protein
LKPSRNDKALLSAKLNQVRLDGEPFTLVIELDAWNIRERDDWGTARKSTRPARNPNAGIGPMAAPAFGWINAWPATADGRAFQAAAR